MKYLPVLIIFAALTGCVSTTVPVKKEVLRVGVTPDSRPVIFKENGKFKGIEADYARKIGEALGKEIRFVTVPWDKQIDALLSEKTDIIMSGMTATKARVLRIEFCESYLQSGLTAIFRRDSYDPAGLVGSLLKNQVDPVGIIGNTTGEMFVMGRFPRSEVKRFDTAASALKALKSGKINTLVHDAPMLWWTAALNESELASFPTLLNSEPLAWGVRKEDSALLNEINALLGQWREDGTTKEISHRWLKGMAE